MSTTPRKALAALLVLAIDVAFRVLLLPVVWLLAATVGKLAHGKSLRSDERS